MIIKGLGDAFMNWKDLDVEWAEIYIAHGGRLSPSNWDAWIDDGLADVVR